MNHKTSGSSHPVHPASLTKRALQGAAIAFVLISIFLINFLVNGNPDPAWHQLWMVRPWVLVTLGGAMGGICYYMLDNWRYAGGSNRIWANIVSLLIYVIGLWLSFILGLDGTLWN